MIKEKVDLDAKDKWGQTALMLAAGRNDVQSIRLLLNANVNLNIIAKNGLSALGYATENSNGEAAKVLKQAGAK